MARQTFVLGRLLDIEIGVHISWLVVFAMLTLAIAHGLSGLTPALTYAFSAVCALALFASVVAHELAHALAARRFGVRTSAITLFLFGGVATLEEEPATPRADAIVALAGPAMSALLAVACFGFVAVVERLAGGSVGATLGILGAYLALANGVLAAFNLVPAYPMDGGRVLRALLWRRSGDRDAATRIAARCGFGFAVLFVAGGVLVAAATHNVVYGWYALLGAFLLRSGFATGAARLPQSARALEQAA